MLKTQQVCLVYQVVSELPDAYYNFKRHKRIFEVATVAKGFMIVFMAAVGVHFCMKSAQDYVQRKKDR